MEEKSFLWGRIGSEGLGTGRIKAQRGKDTEWQRHRVAKAQRGML